MGTVGIAWPLHHTTRRVLIDIEPATATVAGKEPRAVRSASNHGWQPITPDQTMPTGREDLAPSRIPRPGLEGIRQNSGVPIAVRAIAPCGQAERNQDLRQKPRRAQRDR